MQTDRPHPGSLMRRVGGEMGLRPEGPRRAKALPKHLTEHCTGDAEPALDCIAHRPPGRGIIVAIVVMAESRPRLPVSLAVLVRVVPVMIVTAVDLFGHCGVAWRCKGGTGQSGG